MMRVSSTASTLLLCISICLYPLVFGESVSENVNTTTEYFISNICSAQSKGSGNEKNSEGFTSLVRPISTLFFCWTKERLALVMSINVSKSSLTPMARFLHTLLPLMFKKVTHKMPVDPLICDKPAGLERMFRTLVHALPTNLARNWLRVDVVSDNVCSAEEYGRSKELTCTHFVATNTTCRNVTYARFVLNFLAMLVPNVVIIFSPPTSGLKLPNGVDIPGNAVKAVLNSCWEPELRALLVVYKSHGKWDISPECISILPQVCKRMVDESMNSLFAILKRELQRDIIPTVPGPVRKVRNNYTNTFLLLSEYLPVLYTMFSDVIYQKFIYPMFSRFAKLASERKARKSLNVVISCKGLRGTRKNIVSNLIVLLRLVIVNELQRSITSSEMYSTLFFRLLFPIFNILLPCLVSSAV